MLSREALPNVASDQLLPRLFSRNLSTLNTGATAWMIQAWTTSNQQAGRSSPSGRASLTLAMPAWSSSPGAQLVAA